MLVRQRGIYIRRIRHRSQRFCNITAKDVVRILSSLILPLVLGLVTISITIYQHKSSQDDRREDLNRFKDERREDRNETRIQRDQELIISKMSQDIQNKIAVNRYQDEIFKDYIKEMGDLMKENNGSFTSNRLTAALARVKTVNILRHLDGPRQTHILRFLYETTKVSDTSESIADIMKTAELTGVNFQQISWSGMIENMSFPDFHLRNCTFGDKTKIEHVNFTSTHFDHVNFSSTRLDDVNFVSTDFRNVKFSSAYIANVNFSDAKIFNTNFSSNEFSNVNFSSAAIWASNFSSSNFTNVNFLTTGIIDTNFSFTQLRTVNFTSIQFRDINFSFAEFDTITFLSAELDGINFTSAKLHGVDFSPVHFGSPASNFRQAQMTHTKFEKCDCRTADFSYANLSGSLFWNTNLRSASFRNADLTDVSFYGANLRNADFTNTTITDGQLESARSIRNAKLPNGTLGHGRNMIKNGDANCNITSLHPWHVHNGSIAVVPSETNPNDCRFILQSNVTSATMSQRISLVNVWDSTLWMSSTVELFVYNSSGISTKLFGLNNDGAIIQKGIFNPLENITIIGLIEGMQELEVMIMFNTSSDNKYAWCDNIKLYINYYR